MRRVEDMTIDELRAALLRVKTKRPTQRVATPQIVAAILPSLAKERAEWYKAREVDISLKSPPPLGGCAHISRERDRSVEVRVEGMQVVFAVKCLDCGMRITKAVMRRVRG